MKVKSWGLSDWCMQSLDAVEDSTTAGGTDDASNYDDTATSSDDGTGRLPKPIIVEGSSTVHVEVVGTKNKECYARRGNLIAKHIWDGVTAFKGIPPGQVREWSRTARIDTYAILPYSPDPTQPQSGPAPWGRRRHN